MTHTAYHPAESSADTVIRLAEVYGLYASFYSVQRNWKKLSWENHAFSCRNDGKTTQFFLSLHSPDGLIGHAIGQGISPSALENAFHLARLHMRKNDRFVELLQHLQEAEQKIHYSFTPNSFQTSDKFSRQPYSHWELHHREVAQQLLHSSVSSFLELSIESLYSLRSDGVSYSTSIQRMLGNHTVVENNRQMVYKAGQSTEFGEYDIVEPLLFSMNELIRQEKTRRAFWETTHTQKTEQAYDSNCLVVLDSSIVAELQFARLRGPKPIQNELSRIKATVTPLEGTLGYNPIHPLGYILPPSKHELAILDFDPLYQALFRQDETVFGNHIALRVPSLSCDEATVYDHPYQVLAGLRNKGLIDGESVYILQGVEQWKADVHTSTFALLPTYVYKYESGQLSTVSPNWLLGNVEEFFSAILGGLGPIVIEYAKHTNWSVTVPPYVVLRMNHHLLKENHYR